MTFSATAFGIFCRIPLARRHNRNWHFYLFIYLDWCNDSIQTNVL